MSCLFDICDYVTDINGIVLRMPKKNTLTT
jgi:hypothetical protein